MYPKAISFEYIDCRYVCSLVFKSVIGFIKEKIFYVCDIEPGDMHLEHLIK